MREGAGLGQGVRLGIEERGERTCGLGELISGARKWPGEGGSEMT